METDETLVAEFAQLVLDQAAPEELVLFDETAADYFRDPDGALRARGRDEALGFGLDLALLTPYALAVASSVLSFLIAEFSKEAREEAKPVIADLVRRLFRRPAKPDGHNSGNPPLALSAVQARQVRDVARQKAVASGLPDDKADLLADAVVGGLVIAG